MSGEDSLDVLESIKTMVGMRARQAEEHEFAAFAALMSAYIKLRRWEESTGNRPYPSFEGRYIGEKLRAVFGRYLDDPELRRLLLETSGLARAPSVGEEEP